MLFKFTILKKKMAKTKLSIIIGKHIREIRKKKGLTLEQLADKSNLSLTYTGDIERGKTEPSLKSLKKIADGLGVGLYYILSPLEKNKKSFLLENIGDENLKNFLKSLASGGHKETEFITRMIKMISEEFVKYNKSGK